MSKTPRQQRTVVVDFSRSSIKIAMAERACEAVRFHGITKISRPADDSGGELDADWIVDSLRREVEKQGWSGARAACLLSGSTTSTQSFLFPPMPDAQLRRAIALKLDENLHFDLEDASFDYRRELEGSDGAEGPTSTLVAAARLDSIRQAASALRRAGLKPVAVGASAESLANLSKFTILGASRSASIHVDIGSDTTILNLFDRDRLRLSREIEIAGKSFTAALMRPILTETGAVQLTEAQANEIQNLAGYPRDDEQLELPHGIRAADILPLLEPVLQRLVAEIQRSIDYLSGLVEERTLEILLTGAAGSMRNLDAVLEESLQTPVAHCDPVARALSHWRLAVCDANPPELAGYSAILGYSLGNHRPLNLLPPEQRYAGLLHVANRTRKAAFASMVAFSLFLALASVPIARSYLQTSMFLQGAIGHMDERLQKEQELAAEKDDLRAKMQQAVQASGPQPDWVGVLKELSVLLPEEAQVTSLTAETLEGTPTLYLDALIHPGESSFDKISTRMTLLLAASPYFSDVHIVDAALAPDESFGRFEAALSLVAGREAP